MSSTYTETKKNYYMKNKEKLLEKSKKEYNNKKVVKKYVLLRSELIFKTQPELKSYCKEQALKNLNVVIDKDHNLFKFFLDMFERHPSQDIEDIEENIIEFICITKDNINLRNRKSPPLSRSESFRAYYKTKFINEWVSFSLLNKCVTGQDKTELGLYHCNLRKEIDSQIKDFRKKQYWKCNVCEGSNMIDVDHIIPFKILVTNFEENNENLSWFEYHLKYAKLQLLCNTCHKNK